MLLLEGLGASISTAAHEIDREFLFIYPYNRKRFNCHILEYFIYLQPESKPRDGLEISLLFMCCIINSINVTAKSRQNWPVLLEVRSVVVGRGVDGDLQRSFWGLCSSVPWSRYICTAVFACDNSPCYILTMRHCSLYITQQKCFKTLGWRAKLGYSDQDINRSELQSYVAFERAQVSPGTDIRSTKITNCLY